MELKLKINFLGILGFVYRNNSWILKDYKKFLIALTHTQTQKHPKACL